MSCICHFFRLFFFAPLQDYFSVEIHEMGSRLGGNSHLQFNCRKTLNLVHEVLIKTRRVLLEYCCYISVVLRRPHFSPDKVEEVEVEREIWVSV